MNFDMKYYMLRACLSKRLNQKAQPDVPPAQPVTHTSHIRFPEINLPRFSGRLADGCVFRDAFDSAIGSRVEISNVEKFQYLKGLVAAKIIEPISISEDGYRDAWRALKLRYENKRQLIRCHIKSLFEVPSIKKESADELLNLVDRFEQQISVLRRLGEDTSSWDSLLVYQLSTRLDPHTLKEWESYCARLDSGNVANVLGGAAGDDSDDDDMPTYMSMVNYLQNYARVLQCVSPSPGSSRDPRVKPVKSAAHFSSSSSSQGVQSARKCEKCTQSHFLYHCPDFQKLSEQQRFEFVKVKKLCANCLRSTDHLAKSCQSKTCNRCNKKHHTLLHGAQFVLQPSSGPQESASVSLVAQPSAPSLAQPTPPPVVNVPASSSQNLSQPPRLSPVVGSHPPQRSTVPTVPGNLHFAMMAYDKENLPGSTINIWEWHIPETLRLADPTFHVSNEIDIILGAQFFFDTLRYGRIQLGEQLPVLKNSVLGWVVSGPCTIRDHDHADPRTCLISSAVHVEELLRKFWELETVHDTKGWSASDKFCEEHFLAKTTRTPEGRYVVGLPKREELVPQLDDNVYQATRRFYSLERSLMTDPQKRDLYQDFIAQYIALGHMREVSEEELNVQPQFVLPHHGVLKPESITTKLRTVQNCKSRSGLSLNDVLVPGPTIQQMLVEIVLRFRLYRFVVTADIEKMYRQILVHSSDQPLQRILWRDDPELHLKVYQLLTITYGLNNSPFLAMRVLQQMATDEECRFPLAARIALQDFYVDNLLTGFNDAEHLKVIVREMIGLLDAGGFPLRQWSSNCQDVLDIVPQNLRETRTLLELDRDTSVNALGLRWEPATDQLSFKLPNWKENRQITKRTVLSQMSSLFDPLGLLGPTIVRAKIIMQALWKRQLEWDTPLPVQFEKEWISYQRDLDHLEGFRIPRLVMLSPHQTLEIYGFSYASLQAYGACAYIRSIMLNGQCYTQLLTAKSRVAPLSSKSIPRLELPAALLLSHLLAQIQKSTSLVAPVYLWTDSTITLDWISAPPSTWKTFCSRVAEIQELTAAASWNHVPSEDNPADLLSRGTSLENLVESSLWWNGPIWIRSSSEPWPKKYVSRKQNPEDPELRKVVALPVFTEPEDIIDRGGSGSSRTLVCRKVIA
nr:uncharacterized protein LOC115270984 [Aedes albopictus]